MFEFRGSKGVLPSDVLGKSKLPDGYALTMLPKHAAVERRRTDFKYTKIDSSYNAAKAVVAIVQLFYALTSLYHARIHQITRFGYAAFGLTVTPYAVMSLLNLCSSILCPDYSKLYLVSSSVLKEVQSRSGDIFEGIVGDLVEHDSETLDISAAEDGSKPDLRKGTFSVDSDGRLLVALVDNMLTPKCEEDAKQATATETAEDEGNIAQPLAQTSFNGTYAAFNTAAELSAAGYSSWTVLSFAVCPPYKSSTHPLARVFPFLFLSTRKSKAAIIKKKGYSSTDYVTLVIALCVYGLIIGIVGGLSAFQRGESSLAQRTWTMAWLATSLSLIILRECLERFSSLQSSGWMDKVLIPLVILGVLALAVPPIGGFVVVGQMLRSYGTCVFLS
jgi:hypothetical protein